MKKAQVFLFSIYHDFIEAEAPTPIRVEHVKEGLCILLEVQAKCFEQPLHRRFGADLRG